MRKYMNWTKFMIYKSSKELIYLMLSKLGIDSREDLEILLQDLCGYLHAT